MDWIESHIPPFLFIALITFTIVLLSVAYMILLERKIASWTQDRIGPNRTGFDFGLPFLKFLRHVNGLGQPLADGMKFVFKEDYRPKNVDKILFSLAPVLMITTVIVSIAVLPIGGVRQRTRAVDVSSIVPHPESLHTDEAQAAIKPGPQLDAAKTAALKVIPFSATPFGEPAFTVEKEEFQDGVMQKPAQIMASVTYRYDFQIASLNIGVLFILAVLSLAIYGIVLGGWASNNKYSFLGALRATAQMISYEIPLGLSVICIVILYGTLDLNQIVEKQASYWFGIIPAWNIFTQPITFVMFLICIHAEANRSPFDLAEAEQELVGGYHTEYSSMRFALFFLAEYAGMITTSAVCVALFFGGWHLPWIEKLPYFQNHVWSPAHPSVTTDFGVCLIRAGVYFVKTMGIIFIFMWVRWSLPRFRFDQLMMLAWRAMIPTALALLMVNSVVVWMFGASDRAYMRVSGKMALVLLVSNLATMAATMYISRFLPAPPETNRRVRISNSRFKKTPLPAGV